jgi:hypothetical protein
MDIPTQHGAYRSKKFINETQLISVYVYVKQYIRSKETKVNAPSMPLNALFGEPWHRQYSLQRITQEDLKPSSRLCRYLNGYRTKASADVMPRPPVTYIVCRNGEHKKPCLPTLHLKINTKTWAEEALQCYIKSSEHPQTRR